MISKNVMITNPSGLHLRPAGNLSSLAMKFKSDIRILYNDKNVVVKSVLNVMAAGIKTGSEVTLTCDGPDEQEAMDAITKAIADGLGE